MATATKITQEGERFILDWINEVETHHLDFVKLRDGRWAGFKDYYLTLLNLPNRDLGYGIESGEHIAKLLNSNGYEEITSDMLNSLKPGYFFTLTFNRSSDERHLIFNGYIDFRYKRCLKIKSKKP